MHPHIAPFAPLRISHIVRWIGSVSNDALKLSIVAKSGAATPLRVPQKGADQPRRSQRRPASNKTWQADAQSLNEHNSATLAEAREISGACASNGTRTAPTRPVTTAPERARPPLRSRTNRLHCRHNVDARVTMYTFADWTMRSSLRSLSLTCFRPTARLSPAPTLLRSACGPSHRNDRASSLCPRPR